MTQPVALYSTDGLELEGLLDTPDQVDAALVLCHPHPNMGGTMNAPLLQNLAEHAARDGWAVVRFNFRGIGASQGRPSSGEAETADAAGAVKWLRQRHPSLPIAIAGWSFGGAVAVRVAATGEDDIFACVAIAPAVRERPGVTAGLPAPEATRLEVPTLLVCAANDHLVDPQDCRGWTDRVPRAQVVMIKGANHFFWGRYDALADAVMTFLTDEL